MKDKDKERILVEVESRVIDLYGKDSTKVEEALFDTLYKERQRLKTEPDRKKARRESSFYNRIYTRATRANPERQRELLMEIIRNFAGEVVGHFDPRVYAVATSAVPPVLTVLLNTLSPIKLLNALPGGLETLGDQLRIEGEVGTLKALARRGTTILVSTHQSNLDSILLGYSLFQMGLPPYTYGAGLNLFSNKMMGFFMHNLGAYKVDRRKSAEVYKDVLKTYAGCTMESGYHNMFFPAGTRSRSGAVEEKLKMGLLGMGLDAYIHNLMAKKRRPDVYVVPCTINYQLVLEAETLIDDYLKDVGKSRYIIEDDEFSKPRVVLDFVRKLFSLDSRINLHISKPLDVFGNPVDRLGRSHDRRGRIIDRKRYVFQNGAPAVDRQRDEEYTRELARSIVRTFHRDTVIKSTNIIAHAVFGWLRDRNPEMDLYRLLRTGGTDDSMPLPDAYRRIDRAMKALRLLEREDRIILDETARSKDTVFMASEALAHLKAFHRHPALVRRGDRLFYEDRNLLLFYQNRLTGFGLKELEAR